MEVRGTATLLANREEFSLPEPWFHVTPLVEQSARTSDGDRVLQVIDRAAVEAIVNAFKADAAKPNFPGILVDYDHLSHVSGQRTEAAGWIVDMEVREDGLWAKAKWSRAGRESIQNGEYRLVSPVFTELEDLGKKTVAKERMVRPLHMVRCALTNDPNLKGARPLSNRSHHAELKPTKIMDYRTLLTDVLSLNREATDEELEKAVANAARAARKATEDAKAKVATLETENEKLRTQVESLNAAVLESDVAKYSGLMPEEELRATLAENRAVAVKLLEGVLKNREERRKDETQNAARMFDPNKQKVPPSPDAAGAANGAAVPSREELHAAKVVNRANELFAVGGRKNWSEAWSRAVNEVGPMAA